MKRIVRCMISGLLGIGLLGCTCLVSAMDYENELDNLNYDITICDEILEQQIFYSDQMEEDEFWGEDADGLEFFSDANDVTNAFEYYGNQLTGYSKEVYEACRQLQPGEKVCVTVSLEEGKTVYDYWPEFRDQYSKGLFAYKYDYPAETSWTSSIVHANATVEGDKAHFYAYYDLSPFYQDDYPEQMQQVIAQVISEESFGDIRSLQVKSIHDWIINQCVYDYGIESITSDNGTEQFYLAHGPVGCILKGTGVCETYAKSFKMFCDQLDIPCVLVMSATHMWNYVLMEDDEWYMIDCTWDDKSYGPIYDYFLVSNEPAVNRTHTVSGNLIPPTTSTTAYHSWDEGVLLEEATHMQEGRAEYHCLLCDESLILPIPRIEHVNATPVEENRIEATEDADGMYELVVYCEGCGALLSRTSVVIPKLKPEDEIEEEPESNPEQQEQPVKQPEDENLQEEIVTPDREQSEHEIIVVPDLPDEEQIIEEASDEDSVSVVKSPKTNDASRVILPAILGVLVLLYYGLGLLKRTHSF